MSRIIVRTVQPPCMTPLGTTGKLRYSLANEKDYVVLVTILTDGEENASHEFTGKAIHNLVQDLEKEGWVFTYIGTNPDVSKEAIKINIKNVLHFDNNQASMNMAMKKEK